MDRILSKEEIAELLSAVRGGEVGLDVELGRQDEERHVEALDLARPHWAWRWRSVNFDDLFDGFAKQGALSFSSYLQQAVTMKRHSVESLSFSSLIGKQEKNPLFGIVKLDPLKSVGMLIFDAPLAFSFVEIMLGCAVDTELFVMDRAMTAIEVNLVKGLMAGSCKDLQKAFQPLEKLETALLKVEVNHKKIKMFTPETELLLARFSLSIGSKSGMLSLAIPYAALEPLKEKFQDDRQSNRPAADNSWAKKLLSELREMETEVVALSGEITLQLRDIIDLQVGDVIDLDYNPHAPLRILVERQPLFLAAAGTRKGKKAARIIRKIKQGENYGNNGC